MIYIPRELNGTIILTTSHICQYSKLKAPRQRPGQSLTSESSEPSRPEEASEFQSLSAAELASLGEKLLAEFMASLIRGHMCIIYNLYICIYVDVDVDLLCTYIGTCLCIHSFFI